MDDKERIRRLEKALDLAPQKFEIVATVMKNDQLIAVLLNSFAEDARKVLREVVVN